MITIKSTNGVNFHIPSGQWETRNYSKSVKNPNPTQLIEERYLENPYYKKRKYWDDRMSIEVPKLVQLSLCGAAVLRAETSKNATHEWDGVKEDYSVCEACKKVRERNA